MRQVGALLTGSPAGRRRGRRAGAGGGAAQIAVVERRGWEARRRGWRHRCVDCLACRMDLGYRLAAWPAAAELPGAGAARSAGRAGAPARTHGLPTRPSAPARSAGACSAPPGASRCGAHIRDAPAAAAAPVPACAETTRRRQGVRAHMCRCLCTGLSAAPSRRCGCSRTRAQRCNPACGHQQRGGLHARRPPAARPPRAGAAGRGRRARLTCHPAPLSAPSYASTSSPCVQHASCILGSPLTPDRLSHRSRGRHGPQPRSQPSVHGAQAGERPRGALGEAH